MEFRLLGPVELWVDGQRRQLGTAKERCVLATLLLTPGQTVPADTLIDRVWDYDPPAKPRQNLYTYIKRLRNRLTDIGDISLKSRSGGYLLQVSEENIDWHRFRRLRAQARSLAGNGDHESAVELHREAARLWHAEPLADLSGEWITRTRTTLVDELLAATFERIELELELGHHADLVGELSDLVGRYPWDEKLAGHLMVALYRCGRQAEALQVYRDARDRTASELGMETWPGLRDLHQRILQGDQTLLSAPKARPATAHPPNTLPRDIHTFTGRQDEIKQLLQTLPHHKEKSGTFGRTAGTLIAIDGMPGVGKTTLAIHLAHNLAPEYPDGQLFINMHAHDPGQRPVDPATALDALLRVLGVPPGRIPRTLDERIALWRAHLAHRRVLVVLDDAAGRDQVLPLLPGSPGSLVILTSRRSLSGLEDPHSRSLEVLPIDDAVRLFTNVVGPGRYLDSQDIAEVVRHCGHLPLAVQIAASKLRHRPKWSVADLLTRLAQEDRRLEELQVENRAVTAIFEMSYRGLSTRQQRAFRLCALHPGPDFTAHTAAVALRTDVVAAERILEELLDCNLIIEPVRGRFRYHALLHEYARWLSLREDSDTERKHTMQRILDAYLWIADQADRLRYPHRRRISVPVTHPPPSSPIDGTAPEAQNWLTTEHAKLISAPYFADRNGWSGYIAYFAHVLAGYLESGGHWEEAARLHERAVAVWRDDGDEAGLAYALSDLSTVQWRTGDYDRALETAGEALGICLSSNDRIGQADLLDHIGQVNWHISEYAAALPHFQEAYDIRCDVGDRRGQADALTHIAFVLFDTGKYARAQQKFNQGLAIYRELGDWERQMMTLNNLGDIELRFGHADAAQEYYEHAARVAEMNRQHKAIWQNNMANVFQHKGRYSTALSYYRIALETYRQIGDRQGEADVLINIGSTFQRMGRHGEALINHQMALSMATEISERSEQTRALRHIGQIHHQSGRFTAAYESHRRALDLAIQIQDPYERAQALNGIGYALLHTEGQEQALHHWRTALRLYEQLGVPEAKALREKLQSWDDDATEGMS